MHIENRRATYYSASSLSTCARWRWFIFTLLLILGAGLGACTDVSMITAPVRPTRISSNTVLPVIEVSPSSGYAGVYIQIKGSHWPSNSLILLALEDGQGRSDILAATNADSNGNIETGFLYPTSQRWLSPGEYTILAYTGNASRQITASFNVTEASVATPTAAPALTSPALVTSTATLPPPEELTTPTVTPATPTAPTVVEVQDWRGEYWNNPYLDGAPVLTRDDPAIVFDWGLGSPAGVIPVDYFSARWNRPLYFAEGVYRFFLEVDDGARLSIDSIPVLNEWREGSRRTVFVDFSLNAGVHLLQIEYFEQTERSLIRFWWERW
jgi:hypothetical protein